MRCGDCPVPVNLPCRGEAIPHKCESPRYRAYFLARATGQDVPIPAATRMPRASLLQIAACDYRVNLNRLRNEGSEGVVEAGCSCTALCLAGQSTRPDQLVGRECYDCELAGLRH